MTKLDPIPDDFSSNEEQGNNINATPSKLEMAIRDMVQFRMYAHPFTYRSKRAKTTQKSTKSIKIHILRFFDFLYKNMIF